MGLVSGEAGGTEVGRFPCTPRVPLAVQTFRSLGLPSMVREHARIKERDQGHDEATMVESFVILNAVGGGCCDDFERLREDPGISEMIGHEVPRISVSCSFP